MYSIHSSNIQRERAENHDVEMLRTFFSHLINDINLYMPHCDCPNHRQIVPHSSYSHTILNNPYGLFLSFFQMNFLLISLLAVGAVTLFPRNAFAASSGKETEELPRALPLTAAAGGAAIAPDAKQSVAGEIWQEDDHEILIRSERGAKNNNGGPSSGKEKKQKRVHTNRKLAEPKTEQKNEQKNEHIKNEHKVAKKPSKFVFYLFIIYLYFDEF